MFMQSQENPLDGTFCINVEVTTRSQHSGNTQGCESCDSLDTMCTLSGAIPDWGSRDLYTRAECRFGNQITLA